MDTASTRFGAASEAAPAQLALSTERLLLRDLEESDWPIIAAYASLPEARRYMLAGQGTRDKTRNFVLSSMAAAQARPRVFFAFGVVLRDEDRLVGTVVLRNAARGQDSQLGWDVNREYWNRGIATEAARRVLVFAFDEIGVRTIQADSFAGNRASIRVMEKIGMQRETGGLLAGLRLASRYGELRPMVRYVLSSRERKDRARRRPPTEAAG
jgi:RimJ/RimL family protein N-acetyltransferase